MRIKKKDLQNDSPIAKQLKAKGVVLPKPHKYGAKTTYVDGIRFPSKKEAGDYTQLKFRENIGLIKNLTLQPRFKLIVNETLICEYRADFQFFDVDANCWTVWESKGFKTPEYIIKKKLFQALYPQFRFIES